MAPPELSTACEEGHVSSPPQKVVDNSAETQCGKMSTHRFRYEHKSPSLTRIRRDFRAEAVCFGPKRTLQITIRQGLAYKDFAGSEPCVFPQTSRAAG